MEQKAESSRRRKFLVSLLLAYVVGLVSADIYYLHLLAAGHSLPNLIVIVSLNAGSGIAMGISGVFVGFLGKRWIEA